MAWVQMELARILIQETTDGQQIVLREVGGERAFPIVIGFFEAAAIDRHVRDQKAPRPMTHDLIGNVVEALGWRLDRIVVTKLESNTFYANLVLKKGEQTVEVDARPSDAIAVAVRAGAPIFVDDSVLERLARQA